jgi:hypothetical protein
MSNVMLESNVYVFIHRTFYLLLRELEIVLHLWLIRFQGTFALFRFFDNLVLGQELWCPNWYLNSLL